MKERFLRAYRGETTIDFIGRRKLWFMLSAAVLLVCIGSFFTRELNLGIEFEGGLQLTAPVPEDGPLGDTSDQQVVTEVEDAVAAAGAAEPTVQVASDDEGRSVLVQTESLTGERAQRIQDAVEESVGAEIEDSSAIGEKWGGEVTNKALRGLVIFVFVVVLFISLQFEWKMALSSMIALVHDLIITAGVYSLVGFEVTPASVIAILTILGYSLYDTVVVFDRVEEDTNKFAATGKMTYQDSANQAMNEVFMRSLNTSLSTILPVGALLFVGAGLLGASTLKDLALALLVGLGVGAYSSIFVATPFLAMLKEREPKYRNVRAKVLREARRAGTVAPAQPVVAEGVQETPAAPAPKKPAVSAPAPAPARPRAGTKKAKRRKRR
ncbi:MAG: protein translocase subunit SecF [Actinomycetota bacterium]|nr:protein translocase subunit SecF [Actinomycetota bacterium]